MYDLDKAFNESGLTQTDFERIKQDVRKEFPTDDMMYELHVLRALRAVKKGYWKMSGG